MSSLTHKTVSLWTLLLSACQTCAALTLQENVFQDDSIDILNSAPSRTLGGLLLSLNPSVLPRRGTPAAMKFHVSLPSFARMQVRDTQEPGRKGGAITIPRPREETTEKPKTDHDDLEWFQDEELRKDCVSWAILLLGSTFEKPRMTPEFAANSIMFVLNMAKEKAFELASLAEVDGMSVLGEWPREKALELGAQLKRMELNVRIVPGIKG
mmetsp:Transcript_18989/g.30853  ORF Transcript_18989/g.30853 Transcript_18989/m.30853 type:complete len:211 (-) Transcript_18989:156-788(-)|eukprot:CAMPEP_0169123302 /NCGR_PEP_ID=MMETSP1015-20121227/33712_1 /TAXON_ID=342587 /ORGANISM="Karlodinium micrum, Strain CCMP2283" /LENGTH=210 /DNA_ID=CAMNT_0009186629 /DNA_START=50 /DNA_END=682 /DNA_ORIENTATION=-